MIPIATKNFFKLSLVFPVILALVLGFFCTGIFTKTPMHMTIIDSNALSTMQGEQSCCGTSMSQHMNLLHNTSLALPDQARNNWGLIILSLIFAFTVIGKSLIKTTLVNENKLLIFYKLYLRQNPDLVLFNQLKLAFARGILNPKIY